ncbi:hypothetical protein JOQ06_004118, partial [Pogonophryne albipinna]
TSKSNGIVPFHKVPTAEQMSNDIDELMDESSDATDHDDADFVPEGSDCFRKYANQSGAKNPEALTSTRLRKQVATLSTVLNLKEDEMDQLATFLGHDIRVHREFYRLPESTLQLAKVSKLLIAMEKGRLSDLQGKGLDDIEINPEDEVSTSDDETGEESIADIHQNIGILTP